jgi:GT2 family glycosyltransferase
VTEATEHGITVSIVSHGQAAMVSKLLQDLAECPSVSKVILTQNCPEAEIIYPDSLSKRVRLIQNAQPLGFAANHNQAFQYCETNLFAVLNPDLRLSGDPFTLLADSLISLDAGVIAPTVRNPEGGLEDSARCFPTPLKLICKLLGRGDGRIAITGLSPLTVDWVAGMFLLFRVESFRSVGGFDPHFFLYYEDVDICTRLWNVGLTVILHPEVSVVHDAQRASRRKLKYFVWHLSSMTRYFIKNFWRSPRRRAQA